MTRYRVLVTDRAWPNLDIEAQILAPLGVELIEPSTGDPAELLRLAADCDALAANWAPVTAQIIRAATRCRVICRTGIGLDSIAVDVATERGIPVTNVPDYCVDEVADHAMALLLACARKVAFFHLRTKHGQYELQSAGPIPRLAEKTLGLIGLGRIGSNLARKARAFGLTLLAHTPSNDPRGTECRMVPLDELLAESDFVSLHAPLTEATRSLLGEAELNRMRRTAYLINTSRGGLIDSTALAAVIAARRIAGAALDVFEPEPPDLSLPLYRDERVIITPHASFVSEESLIELRTRVARQVAETLSGRRPENVVNPEVFG